MKASLPKMLKIAVCIDFFYETMAGAEANSLEVARRLRDKGHEVEIISSRSIFSSKKAPDESFPIRTMPGAYAMREYSRIMPTKKLADFCYQFPGWLFRRGLRRILQRHHYDLIYTYSYDLLKAASIGDISVPIVFTVHNPIFPKNESLLSYAAAITCVSKLLQEDIKTNIGVETVYIPPVVDLEKFQPTLRSDLENLRQELRLKEEDRVLVFANRLIPFKNCETLLKAMPAILSGRPDTKLIILGQGVLHKQLKSLAHTLGIGEKVYFMGAVPNEEVSRYLNLADLVVIPSFYESCSLVGVESLAAERPLIVSNGMKEFLGLFPATPTLDPKSKSDIADKVLDMLKKPIINRNLDNLKLFDAGAVANKYEKLFIKALNDEL